MIEDRLSQPRNELLPTLVIELGMETEMSSVQLTNAESMISVQFVGIFTWPSLSGTIEQFPLQFATTEAETKNQKPTEFEDAIVVNSKENTCAYETNY